MNETGRIAFDLSFTLFGGAVTFFRFYIRYITNRGPKQVAYFVCDGFVAVALITTVVFTACDVWVQIEKARTGVRVGTHTSLPLDLMTTIMKVCSATSSGCSNKSSNRNILIYSGDVFYRSLLCHTLPISFRYGASRLRF